MMRLCYFYMEFLYPEYRLDWFGAGPSSPNKTGALLAILFVLSWWPSLRFRWGFWLSLPVSFVLLGLLLQTESRGALVGVVVGSVLLLSWSQFSTAKLRPEGSISQSLMEGRLVKNKRYFSVRKCLRVVIGLMAGGLLFVYSQQLGVNDRVLAVTSGADESSNVRLKLYTAGLRMIADAPFGWGHGQAGNAYGQWYQQVGDSRSYLSLVNSHLTWMADYGSVFQLSYILAWVFVFFVCWPCGRRQNNCQATLSTTGSEIFVMNPVVALRLIAFATWIVLGVCGFFSSVLSLIWLWCVPVGLLLLNLIQRLRLHDGFTRRQCLLAIWITLFGFISLQVGAHVIAHRSPQITVGPERIEIGSRPEAIAIIQPDRKILGDKYGHTIREFLAEIEGVTLIQDVVALDAKALSDYDALLFSGSIPSFSLDNFPGRVVLLNPAMEVDDMMLVSLTNHTLIIVIGRLGNWRRNGVWQALAEARPNWEFIQVGGAANYLPGWPRYLNVNTNE
jgi:hypothetical protein